MSLQIVPVRDYAIVEETAEGYTQRHSDVGRGEWRRGRGPRGLGGGGEVQFDGRMVEERRGLPRNCVTVPLGRGWIRPTSLARFYVHRSFSGPARSPSAVFLVRSLWLLSRASRLTATRS